ncbi:MAG: NADP-dependent isocitrate dehydrogenase [Prevotellaceae bacterium]|jgi:isocitrate dehydrogenase|nr:NADP-dependent isocitrate dehydrogenase [Prevotellaceae bacterium]
MNREKWRIYNGKPTVPDHLVVPFITGDGIGVEITPAMQKTVDAAVKKAYRGKRSIVWKEVSAGEKSFKATGEWLPDATVKAFDDYLIGIKGPLTTPVGGGIRSINVALRQTLDLYACVRPIRWFKGISSPVKHPEKVDMTVFRENTEDIYAGIEWDKGTPEADKFLTFLCNEMHVEKIRFPQTSAFGVKPVSEEGTKRLVESAILYALENKLPSVTLVHKGNIMKFTEGGFKRWGYELAREAFGDRVFTMTEFEQTVASEGREKANERLENAQQSGKVIIRDVLADAFLQNTLLKPEAYSVIATLNLNGDYISDQLAAMVGGIGISPGANINYQSGHAIFEATHGTAPDIAGENKANPSSLVLSAVMLLEHIGWNEAATMITKAMENCFLNGNATSDLSHFMPNGQHLSTSQFQQALENEIEQVLI